MTTGRRDQGRSHRVVPAGHAPAEQDDAGHLQTQPDHRGQNPHGNSPARLVLQTDASLPEPRPSRLTSRR
jgi:hypothetical protein